jgi:5-hydroxyisourate hydrolase
VNLAFTAVEDEPHYHVALLLSPFAYTTYRGS